MTRRDSQLFTTQKIQENNKIEIQKIKDLAVDQVLGDLKRDIPDFEIEREELIKALDINPNVRFTLDIYSYIKFLRSYLWYKYNIDYLVYKYVKHIDTTKINSHFDTMNMLNDFLEKEILKQNKDIARIVPRLTDKLSKSKYRPCFDDIIIIIKSVKVIKIKA